MMLHPFSRRSLRRFAPLALLVALGACASSGGSHFSAETYSGYDKDGTFDAATHAAFNKNFRQVQFASARAQSNNRPGIADARAVHYRYSDRVAEQFDGNCEHHVSIHSGETLSDIAEYCDVPVRALIAENPDIDPHAMEVGTTVRIPNVKGNVYQ